MKVSGSAFLVSGGSSGLGAASVRSLVQSGARVAIADLNEDAGHALQAELGPQVTFVPTDVTEEDSVRQAVRRTVEVFGSLRGAVSCAGIAAAERLLGKSGPHSLNLFMQVIRVNLVGTFNVMRMSAAAIAEAPPLEDGARGVLINTASVAAFDGQIGQAAYSASKGGIVSMTLPAAREFARFGIRVVTIAPGIFDTPLLAKLPEAARESLGQQVPFPKRLGRPSEFATLVVHIAENDMLNGAVVRLDGAIRMAEK